MSGQQLDVRRDGRRTIITGLPQYPPAPFVNVMELELDGTPEPQYYY